MTTREALCALFFAILLAAAGFTWLYGPYGLIGGGAAIALTTMLTDHEKKGDEDG
jgi:predicted PurR-regulated permease PerM